ncbi:MAG: phosphate signaling complex protein PhoU [Lachnospiraceae bacterium]|nr:phosphate signaling complex protein PhoU [Lachnospiraceae bacterium]
MRNVYKRQLEQLKVSMIEMGNLCEEAIFSASNALLSANEALADKVTHLEEEIDRMEREIENHCMKMLLHQQPVAGDFRTISSALRMISDMERIGDQAYDIAEISKVIGDSEVRTKVHIKDMTAVTIKMVTDAVESFVNQDLNLAKAVMEYDDIVDQNFTQVREELIGLIHEDGTEGSNYLDILMIAKYLERIGDHAVNIAEWVEYSITGVLPKGHVAETEE